MPRWSFHIVDFQFNVIFIVIYCRFKTSNKRQERNVSVTCWMTLHEILNDYTKHNKTHTNFTFCTAVPMQISTTPIASNFFFSRRRRHIQQEKHPTRPTQTPTNRSHRVLLVVAVVSADTQCLWYSRHPQETQPYWQHLFDLHFHSQHRTHN